MPSLLPFAKATGLAGVVAMAACVTSCLPKDTRPTPAEVQVTITSDDLARNGIPATTDGWSIAYDRFLVTVGNAQFDGDGCNDYSEANYNRIVSARVAGAQRLGVLYGLGQCDFGFRVSNPSVFFSPTSPDPAAQAGNTLAGAGVTDSDGTLMSTPETDPYTKGPARPGACCGISIYVKGSAKRGDVTKTFTWPFRRRARYQKCSTTVSGTKVQGLALTSGGHVGADLRIHGGALFADSLDETHAKLRFDVFADADTEYGNGDGDVTLAELGRVPFTKGDFVLGDGGAVEVDGSILTGIVRPDGSLLEPDGGVIETPTLEDYLYLVLFPRIVSFGGAGTCEVDVSNRFGRR
jgi:hypothetical protein